MDANQRKDLLIQEIRVLIRTLRDLGMEFNFEAEDLTGQPEAELLALKRDLRDMVRTMGGSRT